MTRGAVATDPDVVTEARALVELYDQRCQLASTFAQHEHPTGEMAREVLAVGERLAEACETFRRSHYPRAARVTVGLWAVFTVSPTGRSHRCLLDLYSEYQLADRR